MVKKYIVRIAGTTLIITLSVITITPVVLTLNKSFNNGIRPFFDFLIWQPKYLNALSNSLITALCGSIGAIIIAVPAAFVLSKTTFKGRDVILYLYIIVMMMPFQVTLLPQYIVAVNINTYDSLLSLIIPGIFSPFSVFLLVQTIKTISNDIIEYAQLDTSSVLTLIIHIIIPNIGPGVICTGILVFCEQWNLVAEPLVLIESFEKYPYAVILSNLESGDVALFAGAAFFIGIPLILFSIFNNEVMDGLEAYKLK